MAYKSFDDLIAGLQIFQENLPEGFHEELCPAHDVISFWVPDDITLSPKVVGKLEAVGWHHDEDELEKFYFFT